MKFQSLVLAVLFLSFSLTSCKKINEATELGADLIPAIDNVTTFDTTLSIEAYNLLFSELEDTTTAGVRQYLGAINNDPLFGESEASMFFQLRPPLIRSAFPFPKDSLVSLDSTILVLSYTGTYGDTTKPQQVGVYEIPANQVFDYLQNYKISRQNFSSLGSSLGPLKTFVPQTLNDSMILQRERVANQLRIPLNNSFGMRFINYDSTNAYQSDSSYKTYFNGFAVVPQNNGVANALVGFDVINTSTRLAFYVRYKNAGRIDTATVSFILGSTSAVANYIKRDYSGAEISNAVAGTTPDPLIYLQASPGSYAKVKIPALGALSNRVVHLAELIVEQVHDPLTSIFTPPTYLYVDAFDSVKKRYRTIPFDVALTFQDGTVKRDSGSFAISNAAQFGMVGRKRIVDGNEITQWNFNLTRYVQRVVNSTEPAQELRLYAPFPLVRASSLGVEQYINTGVPYAIGRVRVGGGNHPTQRMRMRMVYSKL